MEILQKMLDSIELIETRLDQKLEIDEIARAACQSRFHFQRMFHMLTGVTVSEYIRKRRLTLAAQELWQSNAKVIDVAYRYGYETPESFSKAFRKAHGISPSEVRLSNTTLKAYPRLSFHIQIKGEQEMDYKIIEKEAFKVIGRGRVVTTVDGENLRAIPAFWEETHQNGLVEALKKVRGEMGVLGVCTQFDPENEQFTYFIGTDTEKGQETFPDDWETIDIPASTWAVFESVGPMPHAIQKVWERIYSEWFPSTGYEHADAPEIEVYPEGDTSDPGYRSEIWIPIMKK